MVDVSLPPSYRGLNSMILPVLPLIRLCLSSVAIAMDLHLNLLSCQAAGWSGHLSERKFRCVGTSVDLHAVFQDGGFINSARVYCQPMFPVCRGSPSGG